MNTAFWYLDVKSFEEESRNFEGIASTPTVDRMGDIVEPNGAQYTLPIPLMWEHGKKGIDHPVGWITDVKVKSNGIAVKGHFAKLDGPPTLKEALDTAWALVKSRLVRGLSIGFNPLEGEPIKGSYGTRFTSWEWLELSPVSVAANPDSMMTSFKSMDDFNAAIRVKSIDAQLRSASGDTQKNVVRLTPKNSPGVPGSPRGKPVKQTVAEQITSFENKRAATQARMDEIMSKSAEESRTLDATENEEYDGLETELKAIDGHVKRLKAHEANMVAKAAPVVASTPEAGVAARRHEPIQVRSMAPKGIGPARMAIAMWHAKNNPYLAADLCKKHWPDMPELGITLKAIVEAADTTTSGWASQLLPAAQQLQNEFIDMYRDATIIGRIPGLRRVPFNVAVPLRTAAGTFQWVGEAAAKPVTSETFDRVTLTYSKAAAITVITQELAKFSSPSAELLIRDSMRETLIRFLDSHFVSTTAAVSGVSPAGILNGISATSTTGTTAATFRTDMNNMLNNFTANKVPLGDIVILMSSTQALALSLMVTDLGVPLFPNIGREGGSILGFPCIISEAVGTKIIGISPSNILLAEDPGVSVSVSDQATIEMESTPAVGEQSPPSTQSVLKSMFQNNLLAIRSEQFITWTRAQTKAVEYINSNAYVP